MTETASSRLHPAAARGFSVGADLYVAGRPDYPDAIVDWLKEDVALGPGRIALELGAGTGKFLPRLRATGAWLIAVEPIADMRARLIAANPDVDARTGTAESIPAADESVDAVVCAQAFHWFANAAALAEIRRVLKTGRRLGLLWNVRDDRVAWVAELKKLMAPYQGDTPSYSSGRWRQVFPAEGFSPLVERVLSHAHVGAPEQVVVDRVVSTSFIAALPAEERERVAERVRELIAATPELANRATVAFPYETHAYSCAKLG